MTLPTLVALGDTGVLAVGLRRGLLGAHSRQHITTLQNLAGMLSCMWLLSDAGSYGREQSYAEWFRLEKRAKNNQNAAEAW